jgi:hypothetical protein
VCVYGCVCMGVCVWVCVYGCVCMGVCVCGGGVSYQELHQISDRR